MFFGQSPSLRSHFVPTAHMLPQRRPISTPQSIRPEKLVAENSEAARAVRVRNPCLASLAHSGPHVASPSGPAVTDSRRRCPERRTCSARIAHGKPSAASISAHHLRRARGYARRHVRYRALARRVCPRGVQVRCLILPRALTEPQTISRFQKSPMGRGVVGLPGACDYDTMGSRFLAIIAARLRQQHGGRAVRRLSHSAL